MVRKPLTSELAPRSPGRVFRFPSLVFAPLKWTAVLSQLLARQSLPAIALSLLYPPECGQGYFSTKT